MSIGIRRPHQAIDYDELARLFPPPPEYFETAWFHEPEQIDRIKLLRMQSRADRAQHIPFLRKRWDEAGFDARDLVSLDDLAKAPTYTVDDIRQSIDDFPPYGDYQGVPVERAAADPLRIHMSGGTTGKPRPTLYTHWDREVGGVLTARGMYMQGIRPGDVVLNSWSYGLHNGAFSFDEPLHRWLNCVVITTSTGNVTSTRKQLDLAIQYEAAAILTTGDYLLRIVAEARSMGIDPAQDLSIRSLATNIGNEEALQEIFGVPAYATYGFHEVGYVAVECPARQGLHIFEDAFHVEVVDPETGEPLPDGEIGSLVVTELYKTGSAQFRYNIMDLSSLQPREQCACGSWQRRMTPFAGRGDNMIKLRGVNVWPEGIGHIIGEVDGVDAEYFVEATRTDGRDEVTVFVESSAPDDDLENIRLAAERRLVDLLGVKVGVQLVREGEIDHRTEIATSPKPKRFADLRDDA